MPISSNFREGLTAQEYFISTHGARKGLADTALRTADAGYLTRRLVDIAQDVIINEIDCGTLEGIWIHKADDVAGQSLSSRLYSRYVAAPVFDPTTGEMLCDRNEIIDHEHARKIAEAGVTDVKVRSAMTCELTHGICAMCYGIDLGRGARWKWARLSVSLPPNPSASLVRSLTLRTFHTGGVAAGGDITTGLPAWKNCSKRARRPRAKRWSLKLKAWCALSSQTNTAICAWSASNMPKWSRTPTISRRVEYRGQGRR